MASDTFLSALDRPTADRGVRGFGERAPVEPGCVHQWFERSARRAPDAPAVVAGGRTMSYGELDARSGRLARRLSTLGVGPDVVVAVACERSAELIVALLGILKAGGAYLPLDLAYPRQRLAFMIEDARVPFVLARRDAVGRLPATARVLALDEDGEDGGATDLAALSPEAGDLAYVIYTSGSTGKPKGAELTHAGLANLVSWHLREYAVSPADRATLIASPAFDASVWETWPYLAAGACLCVPPGDELRTRPDELYRWLVRQRVTLCFLPTPLAEALLADGLPGADREDGALALRALLVGGDRLRAAPPLGLPFRLVNHYGPTESTVVATWGEIGGAEPGPPPIGRPIANTDVLLLGRDGRPVVDGEAGELAVAGIGLARGYRGRPALTAERFRPDPGAEVGGARLYRTGDLARLRADGRLDFLGRIDDQVKVRGFRIELGEIEAALAALPQVREATVVAQTGADGARRLVAYVVFRDPGPTPDPVGRLLRDLGGRLPGYMIPAAVVVLPALPWTANGKVDRRALPPGPEGPAGLAVNLPRTTTERTLAGFWESLFGRTDLGTGDDFFALGGHSLLAGRLLARVRDAFGVELTPAELAATPTIAGLAEAIDGRLGSPATARAQVPPPVRPAPRDRPLPLSFPQERVWFIHRLAPGNVAYNSQLSIRFRGPLDPGIYRRALSEIVRRHEIFRTTFHEGEDGRPVQRVQSPFAVALPLVDLSGLDAARREPEAERTLRVEVRRPYDVSALPLARWTMVRLAAGDYLLIQSEHHFIHDGWSFALLLREMEVLYEAFALGRPSPLPPPPVQYADFAVWQRDWMRGEVLAEHLDYWTAKLAGASTALELPADRPRPKAHSFRGRALRHEIDAAAATDLRGLARAAGVTLFSAMAAGFAALLGRYTGADDLVLGTGVANRRRPEIEGVIGMVVNTLLLRCPLQGDPTFAGFATALHATALEAFGYQDLPFDKLVERLAPHRDLSRNPLFQAMFSFHDSPVPDMEFAGLSGSVYERHNGTAKTDLNVVGIPRAEQRVGRERRADREGITLIWEFSTDLFEPATMERWLGHYRTLLAGAAAAPATRLSELPLMSLAERAQVTVEWAGSAASTRRFLLHERFAEQAQRASSSAALVTVEGEISYGDLAAAARRLARHLRRAGVGAESLVGICLPRSPEAVVAMLAALEAGGAYVPLDPADPPARLAELVGQTGAGVVVTREASAAALAATGVRLILVDRDAAAIAAEDSGPLPPAPVTPDALAYVMFTSGSTGRPKGVAVSHAAVARLVGGGDFAAMGPDETWLQLAPLSFDASTLEVWAALAHGGRLVLPPPGALSLAELASAIALHGVTSLWLTAGLFHEAVASQPAALAPLRQLLAGGDVLAPESVRRALVELPRTVLIDGYGPTENTTFTCCHQMAGPDALAGLARAASVPIGRPIDGTRVAILDPRLWPTPIGIPGRLFAGGAGLARGYFGRPGMTAERFRPDPLAGRFGVPSGTRMYDTGDLARWRPDGTVEFLGRADRQVKIRGFRIEPGEVEAVLARATGVAGAAVVAREDRPGERRLVAYVVPRTDAEAGLIPRLAAHLGERLPAYLVPSAFVVLPELPLTANGKVDRAALPAPDAGGPRGGRPPKTPVEELLAAIFAEVLELEEVAADADFFDLGGHSLLATRVAARVRDAFAVELPLAAVFEQPTVAGLAPVVERARGAVADLGPIPRRDPEVAPPLSFAQERLWFLDRLVPDLRAYHIVRAFRIAGDLDARALAAACALLAARHEALRTTFHDGRGRPVQVVAPPPIRAGRLPEVDLTALPVPAAVAARVARDEALARFDLERGPLLRATLLTLAAGDRVLLLALHHIVADGGSLAPLLRELGAFYAAAAAGRPATLAPLPVQYADYTSWQRARLDAAALERLLGFWRQHLAGAPVALELPADRPRPALQAFRGGLAETRIGRDLGRALADAVRKAGATPFLAFLSVFAALLGRCSGQSEVVLGTPTAGRDRRELEGLIGLFANTLALRVCAAGRPSLTHLLRATRSTLLTAHAHQDLPFEKLVEALAPARDLSRSPLFQVLIAMEGREEVPDLGAGLAVVPYPVERRIAHFDLTLFARPEGDGGFRLVLTYDRALFDRTTGERTLGWLANLLAAAIAAPARPLADLPLLSAPERHQLLVEWNDTAATVAGQTLHGPFERWARERPGAPAVVWPGGELTYGELNRDADRFARRLRACGVGPNEFVGIHLGRSPRLIVTVLAVLKAGGAYVPLESSWPADRVRWIVAEKGVRHLVVEAATAGTLGVMDPLPPLAGIYCFDPPEELAALAPARAAGIPVGPAAGGPDVADGDVEPAAGPDDLAYIIFTSGSTGRPKGVMVRHRPAAQLVRWVNGTFAVGPSDRLLFVTSLSFDLSVYDVFGILAAGGSIRLASDEELRDPERLVEILVSEPVTFWDSAPAALQQCVASFPPPATVESRLRLVFLSGDWIPVKLPDRVRRAFPSARVVALGGATEATVWSNFFRVGRVDPAWSSIPYGRPITNARYHVLDDRLEPLPVGVPGDLWIAGSCVSEGYAAAPRQTAISYRPDPWAARLGSPGQRMYATGDRARYLPGGDLEFLGRRDHQVKLRGFRIELGEIEAVLMEHPAVAEAVVLVREDRPGDRRLVAYLETRGGRPLPAVRELRELARARLPEYMVPGGWVQVTNWPLAATGKLDRRALPPPDAPAADAGPAPPSPRPAAVPARSPREVLERRIAALWQEVLGVERVDAGDNFFDLGGHSLLMPRVQEGLRELTGRRVAMVELFRHPTVALLATALAADEGIAAAVRAAAPAEASSRRLAAGPVAVVGMAGRFPGAADVESFWRLLAEGREGVRRFSRDELLAAGESAERLDDPRFVPARGALDGADLFDADFFAMTPREAQVADPQQRLLLETAWKALEDAGVDPERFSGAIGVFAGASVTDYRDRVHADRDLCDAMGPMQIALGTHPDYLATRISYKLRLTGPSLTVQTACSTSLVAVHLAAASLQRGECDLALAGGVTARVDEVRGYRHFPGGIESPDGHTRSFDASAAGVVGGSGVGVVALKRLADAVADGDTVRAVLLGSAVNNDGAGKVGFTAPSVEGQAAVVRAALDAAGVSADGVGYVEAHGTGTPLGDPVEVAALARAFGAQTDRRGSCWLGSVKTNVGHLDAAAGVAGLIKATLALERESIPPNLHFVRPNPELDLPATPFRVNSEAVAWPRGRRPRRAGVSSFGIGGTNAHAVLEEAPPPVAGGDSRPVQLLVVSARSEPAAGTAAAALAEHLAARPELAAGGLADVAHTLSRGRRALRHRRAVVARTAQEAAEALRGGGRRISGSAELPAPRVAFLFPGQGEQRPGMAGDLYAVEPAFRATVDRAAEILCADLGCDLRELLLPVGGDRGDAARQLARTEIAQPALFAVEVALARLWLAWGVAPQALLGHSLGELAAACLAGVFDFEAALPLVAARGRLMADCSGGDMLAVAAGEEEVGRWLEEAGFELALAAVNAQDAVVVSGSQAAVAGFAEALASRRVAHRRLGAGHAFHSPAMAPAAARFAERVAAAAPKPPGIPTLSNLTGTWLTAEQATDPRYWARQLLEPVRFADGLETLFADEARDAGLVLVEVGPGRALASSVRRHPRRQAVRAVVGSLAHGAAGGQGGADLEASLAALGRLWCEGVAVDWDAYWRSERRRRVPLPTYPFERQPFRPGRNGGPAGFVAGPQGLPSPVAIAESDLGETERGVAAEWSALLGGAGFGRSDDFFDLGGSSLAGLQLGARLARRFGVELPAGFLLEAPTLGALAAEIDRRRAGGATAPGARGLVRLQAGAGDRRPLFLVHQVDGQAYTFRSLARALGADQPLFAVRSPGLEPGEEPLESIPVMAERYVEWIRAEQPFGPYFLGGASMGGAVAYEIACRLTDAGEEVALLALLDTPLADQLAHREGPADFAAAVIFDRTGLGVPPAELRESAARGGLAAALDGAAARAEAAGHTVDRGEALRAAYVLAANAAALYAYRPRTWPGRLLFLRAADRRADDPKRPEQPWIDLAAGGAEVTVVPGDHRTMHTPPHVAEIARRLRAALDLRQDRRCRELLAGA